MFDESWHICDQKAEHQRHIALQLGGMGNLVTFMDYLPGMQAGMYP
jgi:hypothetical protein